ncbi:hypothetical protein BU15DRAFT_86647 [Melanogaster broomeanus]|nr:hypothetical protein BU15DRAFT_86647 [Melanogaster broomeanus]
MSPPSFRSVLPPETLELVLEHISRSDLVSVLTTNSIFHKVAARILYRTISGVAAKQSILLVKALAHNDFYPPFVRKIELDWSENVLTGNFLRLLNRAIKRLKYLLHLSLEFSSHDNLSNMAWVLEGCTFSLKIFMTSMRFLETQNNIVEVCLRGSNLVRTFPLPRTLFPASHISERPIESVSMSLYPGDAATSLDALLLSSRPLRRLTLMSFDIGEPGALLAEIATRLPGLEALHAVELLVKTAPALSLFKALKYITFMAPDIPAPANDEKGIATLWHKACPTLKTIVLPKGVVWGYVNGIWESLTDVV